MVTGTFVSSIYAEKDEVTERQVKFRKTKSRFVVVVLACLVVFGCEYCFDTPSALQTPIEENYKNSTGEELGQTTFNLLYSLYSIPNIVIPLLGGIMIDSKGPRIVLIITATICVIGHGVFTIGGFRNTFTVMLIGRTIFGLGGEVLHASQNTLISKWFTAAQLSMVLGICISFPKLGSALNAVVSPALSDHFVKDANYENVGMPLLVGGMVMVFSLFMGFVLACIDRNSANKEKVEHESVILSNRQKSKSFKSYASLKQVNESENIYPENKSNIKAENHEHFSCSSIKDLPPTYWVLLLVCLLTQALFIPFLDNGNKYFQYVFKSIHNAGEAGTILILPYCVAALCVPPLGYFSDKVKNRGKLLIYCCLVIVFTYAFMLAVETTPVLREGNIVKWIPVGLLGICVAIFCSVVVPTVPMVIPEKLFGTGFGIMEMIQNFGLSLFPLVAAEIREAEGTKQDINILSGFHHQTLFYFLVSCLCLSATIILYGIDWSRGKRLHKKNFRKTFISKHFAGSYTE